MRSRSIDPTWRLRTPHHRRLSLILVAGTVLAPRAPAGDTAAGRSLIGARLPRVTHVGGPFLRRPEVTTVTFAGDEATRVSRLEAFGEAIVRSPWWHDVTAGYCLGSEDCIAPGRAGSTVRLARRLPARVRDVDVELVLAEEARGGALSGLGAEALVLAYLPRGVVLSDAFHARYCAGGPRAFHRMLRADGVALAYAVIPRCGDEAETTATASHEMLEAATNPDPNRPGFRLDAAPRFVAFRANGSEPADPCTLLNRDRHRHDEGGFRVQRAWSNRQADRGGDPCVPSVAERPYLALIPRQPVVRLPSEGATASIVVDAAADRAVAGWSVSAVDLTGEQEGRPYVDARLDRQRVASGDTAVLTLRLLRLHHRQQTIVGLVSRAGAHEHLWPLAVSMR
jgi:hypothetical protein